MYSQRSWLLEDASPLHFERGFLRSLGEGKVDLVLAHPLGVAELSEGTVTGSVIELSSASIGRTPAGDPITALTRRYEVADDRLTYELGMAMETVAMTHHVRSRLQRV